MQTLVSAKFDDPKCATKAVDLLTAESIPPHHIHVIADEQVDHTRREGTIPMEPRIAEGAMIGGLIGAAVGLVFVVLIAVGWIDPDRIAFARGEGTVAAALQCFGYAAFAGLFLGTLGGLGRWHRKPNLPDKAAGDPIEVKVEVDSAQLPRVIDILRQTGGAELTA